MRDLIERLTDARIGVSHVGRMDYVGLGLCDQGAMQGGVVRSQFVVYSRVEL